MAPVVTLKGAMGKEYSTGSDGDFVVTLSETSLKTVTVSYRTVADGSAIDGSDYSGQTGTLTFLPGETQKTVTIDHRYTSNDESDENYTLELFSPENAVLSGGEPTLRATGIILDDNGNANDLALFVSDPEIVEGDSGTKTAVFELTLSEPADSDITLSYTTADGTAKAGQDYVAKSGTVTFKAGQTFAAVEVVVKGDTQVETNENFSLVVTPNGYIQNGTEDSTGSATILPNEREGDNADNVLAGTQFSDVLIGLGGNDQLSAMSNDDILLGGAGNDVLHGGDGRDIVRGEGQRDRLFGEQDDDRLLGGKGNDFLSGGSGNDRIDGGAGKDTADYSGAASGISVNLAISKAQDTGAAGLDTLLRVEHLVGSSFADRLKGNGDANRLLGGGDADILKGRGGDDILKGQAGADVLLGGTGRDRLLGGKDGDKLVGGSGEDIVKGHGGNDQLSGGAGNDSLRGNGGKDKLLGGSGADDLRGGAGNDHINGGKGSDTLSGNAGKDTFVFSKVQGNDVILDFDVSSEKIDFTGNSRLNDFSDVLKASKDVIGAGVEIELHKDGSVIIEDVFFDDLSADLFLF